MLEMKSLTILLFIFILTACSKQVEVYSPKFSDQNFQTQSRVPEYILAVHPLHNPERLQKMFGPIVDYINGRIKNAKLKIEASNSYSDYNEKIKTKRIDFLLPNPYQTTIAKKFGYHVFAKMGDDDIFAGIGLVRVDSKVSKVQDLKNKVITFPAPTALAAAMMPQLYLQKNGLNLKNKEAVIKYVGSQESSILAVYHGEADVGVTWVMAWSSFAIDNPEIAKNLKILFKTKPLINNSLMVKNEVDKTLIDQVREILINMHKNEEGRKILENIKLSKFENANDQTYFAVEKFLKEFEVTFGELPK